MYDRNRANQAYFWALALTFFMPATLSQAERPWEKKMQEFESQDQENPAQPGGVVFVGSSSIRFWDLPRFLPDLEGPVLNRGFGGSHIEHSINQLELLVLKHKPRAVVLYAGDNDIARGKTIERVVADFETFVAGIKEALPETKIYFLSIKPCKSRWKNVETNIKTNQAISAICKKDSMLGYIDIWDATLGEDGMPNDELFRSDALHLSDAGYEVWSKIVMKALTEE